MIKLKHTLSLLFCVVSFPMLAQQFTFSGQIRPRLEYRHGFSSLVDKNTDPALFVQQRSRLNLFFEQTNYQVKLVLQDIRVWGSTSQLNTTDDFSSIHEAWARLMLGKKTAIKFGRQEIAYDDHRILGSVDWAQQARSHDALLFMVTDSTWKMHLGLAFNQEAPSLINTTYNASYSLFHF